MRALLKRIVERSAVSSGLVEHILRRRRGRRLVLAYHNVVAGEHPPYAGDRSLHLPLAQFRQQLDLLQEVGVAVVPLGSDPGAAGTAPEVAITFDDAYAGALSLGITELAERNLPATVFVAPGLLGAPSTWWDSLADPDVGEVLPSARTRLLTTCFGDSRRIFALAKSEGWQIGRAIPEHRIATESELAEALRQHPGLSVGSHTWSHPNLAALASLDSEAAVDEIESAQQWVTARFPARTLPMLAYPYGHSSSESAASAGIARAFLVDGGWTSLHSSPHLTPRFNVASGLSSDGFLLRLAGVVG